MLFITRPAFPSSSILHNDWRKKQWNIKQKGVCSMAIQYDIDDEQKVHNVKFIGGCSGNTQGVAKLVEGMPAKEVIARLEGIQCGRRPTSCPRPACHCFKRSDFIITSPDFCPGDFFQTVTLYPSVLSHLSHKDWTSLENFSRSLFAQPSFLRMTESSLYPSASSFSYTFAALDAFL